VVLTELLVRNAKHYPTTSALTMRMGFRTIHLTYKDVYDVSRKIALLLEKNGINKGDKVLLLAPNSPYWICCFWACLLRGAIVVPLNVQSTPSMIEKIAKQVDAKLFLAHRLYRSESPSLKRFDVDTIKEEIKEFDPEKCVAYAVQENDLVEILYTSGTTGDPKGVMLTHANLSFNIKAAAQMTKLQFAQERLLSILPLSHIFEQAGGFLLAFDYCAHVIYVHSPSAIGDLLKEYRVTIMLVVPEFLKILMGKIEAVPRLLRFFVKRKFGGKLYMILSGGAPLDPVLEKKWNDFGFVVCQGYGLTETSPLISSNTYEEHRFGSVGKIAPGLEVRLSQDGEIQVKGPNVFRGYFKNEEKTQESFTPDGFFKTGDIGELDKDGFLFLKGRKKYMILGPGGQNVFPEDIEDVLSRCEGVKDSAVVGIELESGMVQIHAVLLLKDPDIDPKQIINKANEWLTTYQQITGFSVWPEDDFPRSATKKVKKEEVLKFLRTRDTIMPFIPNGKGPLISLLAAITGVDASRINGKTKVSELQIDSLMRIELLAGIEERFGLLIDEAEITGQTTVDELEVKIRDKKTVKTLPPLRKWPQSWWAHWVRIFGQGLIFLFLRIFVKVRVKGLERIEHLSLPIILMPNHTSYLDSLALVMALPKSVRKKFAIAAANDVLYQLYKRVAFLAELFFCAFPFPRKESENIKLGLDYMGRLLDNGHSIIVYPEGQLSLDGSLQQLKRGAGLVAVEMEAYVVPVILEGCEKIVPYGKIFPRARGEVRVVFGEPLSFKLTDSYVRATETIEASMKKLKYQ
jgi:long-chain acyl-CoA synthetase